MEIIVLIIVMSSLISILLCAYGKQQEKYNKHKNEKNIY